ncbi:MAG: TPR end-of-group domain-containing protein [Chthoniobacterales bacterium]
MRLEWQLRTACGYAELGMDRESIAELNAIPKSLQGRPEVLQLRLHHLMMRKSWQRALTLSRKLCRVAPDCGAGFLHAGFCLNQLGRTGEARAMLLKGPPALRREPIYYYNLGCYEALLGQARDARRHLEISFQMDATFREIAKKDPDLKSLQVQW